MIAPAERRDLTDRLLESQVTTQLAETKRASLQRLSVDAHAGHVTLRGCVNSFYEKQIAIQACRMLSGIEQLTDAVEVAAAY